MNRAQVYREAARLVDTEQVAFSCHAVCAAEGVIRADRPVSRVNYEDMFTPDEDAGCAWGYAWGASSVKQYNIDDRFVASKARECRVLALCFAAAMAETGDL